MLDWLKRWWHPARPADERMRAAYRLHQSGALDAAKAAYREILRLRPEDAEALYLIGEIENRTGNPEAAVASIGKAIAIDGDVAAFHLEYGLALHASGALEATAAAIGRALALDGTSPIARSSLAAVLTDLGRPADAEIECRIALQHDPAFAGALVTFGFALEMQGRLDEALRSYDQAIALAPNDAQARLNRAALRLLTEDYEPGWREFEWRLQAEEKQPRHARFPQPRWDGSDLAGRSLVIYGEQGLGDEIMYASCFPDVLARARQCLIECDPRLVGLFRRSFPAAQVIARPSPELPIAPQALQVELQVAAGSLPLHLRRSAEAFPRHGGYLLADPEKIERWRRRLSALGPGMKIGLSWRGGTPRTGQAWRSPQLEQFVPLLHQPGADFISLQYGNCEAELEQFAKVHRVAVHHWRDALDDYEETAALVCALDLTVSVCTAAVHLAGALGRPAWVMAPVRPEARYGWRGPGMRWYPSVRVFRQATPGDWSTVVAEVVSALGDIRAR